MTAPTMQSHSGTTRTLAGAHMPQRVRKAVQHLLQVATEQLGRDFEAVLSAFSNSLFEAADHARNPALQSGFMRTQAALRREQAAMTTRFAQRLDADLAQLSRDAPAPRDTNTQAPAEAGAASLQLVDEGQMDESLALRNVATRLEARAGMALHLLGQRYGVLAATPAPEPAAQPLGASALCAHLLHAVAPLSLSPETRTLLFDAFERHMLAHFAPFVDKLNDTLAADGVLPGLTYVPVRLKAEPRQQRNRADADADATQQRDDDAAIHAPSDAGTAAAAQAPAPDTPYTGWMGGAEASRTGGAARADSEQAALDALEQLLAQRRAGAGVATQPSQPDARTGATPPTPFGAQGHDAHAEVSVGELVSALNALPPNLMLPADTGFTPGNIRRAVLASMQAQRGGRPASLPRAADDTFELLDLLYARIHGEVQAGSRAAGLLQRLQVPLLQLALQDRGFFVRPQHPARELLNTVAESGARWLGEGDDDPALMAPLQAAVDDVVARSATDPGVFEANNQRLQQQFELAARKAELSERRHVEAARGKEKLELAKRHATATMDALVAGRKPSGFVRTLLDQAWSDVLTLVLLRHGEDSVQWREVQDTTRAIVACGLPGAPPPDAALSEQVRNALVRVGYHTDEADAIARKLSRSERADDAQSSTELTVKLKARTRLGQQAADAAPAPKLPPRSEDEQARYDQLRVLPYGTWIEFTTNQQGDRVRRRLSWYSPITDHALFVNQRGQRVGEFTLDGVARQMARGQARIVTADQARLVDRAWRATLNALRALGGRDASAEATA